MSNLWLDRPWWKRGILYHLYLVVLKDNWFRTKRAVRWARVNARVSLRWCVRYLTGRRYTVPLPDPRRVMMSWLRQWALAAAQVQVERESSNRALLTGMVVALTAGPSISYSGWEYYRAHLGAKRNGAKGRATRWVGRPSVYAYGPNKIKVGLTEFVQDYVPRAEQLAARRALKRARQEGE